MSHNRLRFHKKQLELDATEENFVQYISTALRHNQKIDSDFLVNKFIELLRNNTISELTLDLIKPYIYQYSKKDWKEIQNEIKTATIIGLTSYLYEPHTAVRNKAFMLRNKMSYELIDFIKRNYSPDQSLLFSKLFLLIQDHIKQEAAQDIKSSLSLREMPIIDIAAIVTSDFQRNQFDAIVHFDDHFVGLKEDFDSFDYAAAEAFTFEQFIDLHSWLHHVFIITVPVNDDPFVYGVFDLKELTGLEAAHIEWEQLGRNWV